MLFLCPAFPRQMMFCANKITVCIIWHLYQKLGCTVASWEAVECLFVLILLKICFDRVAQQKWNSRRVQLLK